MLRKFSAAGIFVILFLLTALVSCNDNIKLGGGNNGEITFDSVRAAKEVIPIKDAIAFQQNFIASRSVIARKVSDTFLTKNFNLPNGEAFTRDALLLLLNQKGADGIRFYYGKDDSGRVRLVLIPINKDGKDIYNNLITTTKPNGPTDSTTKFKTRAATVESDADAVETGQTCPPCLISLQN